MSFMYLPLMIYTATLDAMFQTWGLKPKHTIVAQEAEMLALPAPKPRSKRRNKQGGI